MRRGKFNAKRTACNQHDARHPKVHPIHPSAMEAARCDYHHLRVRAGELAHVDVWPTVTLSIGRYRPDFALWIKQPCPLSNEDERFTCRYVTYEEVKGAVTRDFELIRKLFDKEHPAAPLRVVRLRGKNWEET